MTWRQNLFVLFHFVLTQATQFKYLGCILTSGGRSNTDIRTRIGNGKSAFMEMKKVLASIDILKETGLRTLEYYVRSVLLYGAETWTISKAMKRMEATDIWCCRSMLKVPWTDKRTNTDDEKKIADDENRTKINGRHKEKADEIRWARDESRGTGELGSGNHGDREKI